MYLNTTNSSDFKSASSISFLIVISSTVTLARGATGSIKLVRWA
jgi:hypothetical protein